MQERKLELEIGNELFLITLWGDQEKLETVYVQAMKRSTSSIAIGPTSSEEARKVETLRPGFFAAAWRELALAETLPRGT
jgi:hypothetical protein